MGYLWIITELFKGQL